MRIHLAVVLTALCGGMLLPVRASAEDAAVVRELQSEVQILKARINAQDRRIEALERAINQSASSKPSVVLYPDAAAAPQIGISSAWHSASAWARVKEGMSESQVIAILGRPTSTEEVGPYKTLFYQGPVSGSGSVSGNVKLTDNRVWTTNKPVF